MEQKRQSFSFVRFLRIPLFIIGGLILLNFVLPFSQWVHPEGPYYVVMTFVYLVIFTLVTFVARLNPLFGLVYSGVCFLGGFFLLRHGAAEKVAGLGMMGWAIGWRHILAWLSGWWRHSVLIEQPESQQNKTDITQLVTMVGKRFNPCIHWDHHRGMFLGRDGCDTPIYLPLKLWRERHMQVVGPTGTGKGVLLGNLAAQVVALGDGVLVLDPKRDRFLPHIVAEQCQKTGRRMRVIDLKESETGGWHPFRCGSMTERINRAVEAFDLMPAQSDADVYKLEAKALVTHALRDTSGATGEVLAWLEENADGKARSVRASFETWSVRTALNPIGRGFDLGAALDAGEVVYLRSDPNDRELIIPLRAFLMEATQWRFEKPGGKHLTIIADEVSLYAWEYLAQMLATLREPGCNVVLAYQSLADLESAVPDVQRGKIIRTRMEQNTQLKLFYGTQDNLTAREVALMSGTRTVWTQLNEMEHFLGVELYKSGRRLSSNTEEVIPENLIRRMGERVAIFFQPGEVAQLVFTAPVPVVGEVNLPAYEPEAPLTPSTPDPSIPTVLEHDHLPPPDLSSTEDQAAILPRETPSRQIDF